MTYRNVKKLHNEDEVISKKSKASLYVIQTIVNEDKRQVTILCDDGNEYRHTEIR